MNKASARAVALEDRKLLTESQVFDDEVAAGAGSRTSATRRPRKMAAIP
jgi:hypothetical protein